VLSNDLPQPSKPSRAAHDSSNDDAKVSVIVVAAERLFRLGLAGRLGEAEPSLNDALAQIRLTYVQIAEMMKSAPTDGAGADGNGGRLT